MSFLKNLERMEFKKKILLILGAGILVRVILMPLLAHQDLMSTYSRSYNIAFEGVNPLEYSQQLSHFIQAVFLKLYSIFYDPSNFLPFGLTNSENANVNLNIFLFKIPYLIFDILSFYVLYRMLKPLKENDQILGLAFYFLNPILIYGVYVFGRYEVFPIFFLLSCLYFLQKNKPILSLVMFGLIILSRTSLIMLFPVYFLILCKNYKSLFSYTLPLGIIGGFFLALIFMVTGDLSELKFLITGEHSGYLLQARFELGNGMAIPINAVIYTVFFYFVYRIWSIRKLDWNTGIILMAISLLIYYSTSIFHPQYLSWMVPLLSIAIASYKNLRKELLLLFAGICIVFPLLLLSWENWVFVTVFKPASESIGTYDLAAKSPVNLRALGNLGKGLISGITVSMIIVLGSDIKNRLSIKK